VGEPGSLTRRSTSSIAEFTSDGRGEGCDAGVLREARREIVFVGCSTGGKQAFVEAQRFPDDFDASSSGAPAVDYTGLMIEFNWNEKCYSLRPTRLFRRRNCR